MSRSFVLALSLAVLAAPGLRAQTDTAEPSSADPSIKVSGQDVPPPKRVKTEAPVYPPAAQAAGIRGIVIIEVVIDTQGRVASARLVRSIPGLDEAALAAVQKWQYEVTKVDGKPVSVRHTVPITFSLRLPEVDRQDGVPELRAGLIPTMPDGVARAGKAQVKAQLTVDPDGRLSDAEIIEGDPVLAEAVVRALNTWRFAPDPEGATVVCRLVTTFDPEAKDAAKVAIRLESPQRSQSVASAAPASSPEPTPAAPTAQPSAEPSTAPSPAPATATPSSKLEPATATPSPKPEPAPATATPSPKPELATAPATPQPAPAAPAPAPEPSVTPAKPEISGPPAPPRPAAAVEVISQPPTSSMPTPAPAPSREQGFSSIRDVTLGIGVPDLIKGRRPTVPPVARINPTEGTVVVDFTIDAAGQTAVSRVQGTELLKVAAQQAVQSWGFRRTTPERVAMTAEFVYRGDAAMASVKPTQ